MGDIYHNDIHWGALDTGICHCDVQFGRTFSLATLEQSQCSANCTFGESVNYVSGTDHLDWGRCEWKLTPTDSRPNGNLKITFHIDSGSVDGGVIIRLGWFHDPDLTGDTSNVGGVLTAGNTYTGYGTTNRAYQTGYFDLDPGWNTWSVSFHITKIEWGYPSAGRPYQTIWEDGASGAINHSCIRFG